jgi:hypothetical protein
MELIVLGILVAISFIYFRKFSSIVYTICIFDILLRIITKVETMISVEKYSFYVNKYIPESIMSVIDKYTSGTVYTVANWVYVSIYLIFIILIIKNLFNKKKR